MNAATAIELRCPPLPLVRIGLVGLGYRGMRTLKRYGILRHAEIRAIADTDDDKVHSAQEELRRSGRPEAEAYRGEGGWKAICEDEGIDLLYVCTDWSTHAEMACRAMECGKHVAVEVPAATTVVECRALVSTAERTRRHCFMTENCCYDSFALATLEMARQGRYGDITHCEGAYIHRIGDETPWMSRIYATHGGNPYPTHGLGPIGWLLGLHRGDRMESLVSMTAAAEGPNNTLIRTAKGRTILLQLDTSTPRPYSRIQTICGTAGYSQRYPLPTLQFGTDEALIGDTALREAERWLTSDAALRWRDGNRLGVPNEMNYAMDSRLIHCLHNGLPLDIDVYDAAEWSCIAELSQQSARNGGSPVSVPDFTHGHWERQHGHRFF